MVALIALAVLDIFSVWFGLFLSIAGFVWAGQFVLTGHVTELPSSVAWVPVLGATFGTLIQNGFLVHSLFKKRWKRALLVLGITVVVIGVGVFLYHLGYDAVRAVPRHHVCDVFGCYDL